MSESTSPEKCGACPFLLYCAASIFVHGSRGRIMGCCCNYCANNILVYVYHGEDPMTEGLQKLGWCTRCEYGVIISRCERFWSVPMRDCAGACSGLGVPEEPECYPGQQDLKCPSCAKRTDSGV